MEQKILSEYIYHQASRAWEHRLRFPNKVPREAPLRRYTYNSETRAQLEKGKRPYKVEYPVYSEHYEKCKEIKEYNKNLLAKMSEFLENKKSDNEILEFYRRNLKDSDLSNF
ncbi:MAG: hypothetical protein NC822_03355 [Candidatus Omnitrophica bacterium]|nr:hypothetical protein [Candidatus Omnitrophota bacterium]